MYVLKMIICIFQIHLFIVTALKTRYTGWYTHSLLESESDGAKVLDNYSIWINEAW